MFINLTECYVKAIREGKIPCIESAVEYISKVENSKARQEALEKYDEKMIILKFPVMEKELLDKHRLAQKSALKVFLAKSVFDKSQEEQRKFAKTLVERLTTLIASNEKASILTCKAILEELYGSIQRQIKDGTFLEPGGYRVYDNQMMNLVNDYRAKPGKGVKASAVLEEFMENKQVERMQILNADEKLQEEEKKIEEERAKAASAERMKNMKGEELGKSEQSK
eukprot:TRINITY_DN1025_c0_g1_i4.p1 TRINITY_DN1025_c0_g1~~TRINITY_DN1025_c0_g1_i4.p1  ORF type:complete len:225 (-),score=48.97 TRINITY_DN1025_c0_g1_i4:699-1373(-)